ncbi:MAG: DUF2244 domain-containing protein [Kiloniellales bacterium]
MFHAVFHPHRSLSATGFWILMGLVGLVYFSAGIAFSLVGAWPVFGFLGLDVALVYWAFRLNYHGARACEAVCLTDSELTVERMSAAGKIQKWSFRPYWLRVHIDEPPKHHSQLTLRSHGKSLTIGSFLTPDARLELARALEDKLRRLRA